MPSRRDVLTGIAATGAVAAAGCLAAPRARSQCGQQFDLADQTDNIAGRLGEDTSRDGIPDFVLNAHGLDPGHKHAFVRADLAPGVECPTMLEDTRAAFSDAPIENPDGSTGLDVHFLVQQRDDLADTGERSVASLTRLYHWKSAETDGFDRRHRGYRHLVVDDDIDADGWTSNEYITVADPGMSGGLVGILAAEFAGWFSSLVDIDGIETDSAGLPWGVDGLPVSPDRMVDNIDWELVAENLATTAPGTWWYNEKYAHAAPSRDADPPLSTAPEDPDPSQDTSGDGIPDTALLNDDRFEGASSLRKNVFFEVDYHHDVSRERIETILSVIQDMFADAPVRNADGSMGIDLHYLINDEIDSLDDFSGESVYTYAGNNFQRLNEGYNYLLFVPRLTNNRRGGFAYPNRGFIMTMPRPHTVLHEIGHVLGLGPGYNGVDERRFTFEEYPSVMNYNAPPDAFRFAADDGHPDAPNDWKIIGEYETYTVSLGDLGGD
jgi:hypothetical protein